MPSASSRLKAKVIWVRSLVPKEKKSASSAMASAVRAARGTSIMVPTDIGDFAPGLLHHPAGRLLHQPAKLLQLVDMADEGDHHLRPNGDPLLDQFGRRPENGFRLHLVNLRMAQAQTAAPMPHHRIEFVQGFHLGEQGFLFPSSWDPLRDPSAAGSLRSANPPGWGETREGADPTGGS